MANAGLRQYVQDRLAGSIRTQSGLSYGATGKLEGKTPRTPSGSALGERLESGTDIEQAASGLSGGSSHEDLA